MMFSESREAILKCMVVAVFSVSSVSAQTPTADSLRGQLKKATGTEKVDLLNQITYELISKDNVAAMEHCEQAIALGEKLKYVKGVGVAYSYRGVFEYLSGQMSNGRASLSRGLKLATEVGDRDNQGYTLLQLGNSYLDQGTLDSSLYYYSRAQIILKDSTNPKNLSKLYKNMSTTYGLRAEYELETEYLMKALKIREHLNDKALLADALIILAGIRVREENETEAVTLLNRAEKIVKVNPDDLENLNDIFHQRAMILFRQGKFDSGILLFETARNYYLEKSLLQKVVTISTDLGKVFSNRGEYEVALKNFYEALRISEIKGYGVRAADIYTQIGWINYYLGEFGQALKFANLALEEAKKLSVPGRVANALNLKGVTLTDQNDVQSAGPYLDEELSIYSKLGDKSGQSEALMNIAYLEERKKNFKRALELYERSLNLAEQSNYGYGKAWSCWGIGQIYFWLGRYQDASRFLDRAEKYSLVLKSGEILIRVYGTKSNLQEAKKNFREALRYARLKGQLNDSLHHSDLAKRFVNLQKVEEIEKRDRDIKLLEQQKLLAQSKINLQEIALSRQNVLLILSGVIFVLVACLAFVFIRFYLRIKRLNKLVGEKNENLETANKQLNSLLKQVSEQNEEIKSQSDRLSDNFNLIAKMNKELEGLVAEKTEDLRKTNDELIRHNNELLQFSYTVSHNLRGPVARLLGLTHLLTQASDQSERTRMIDMVRTASLEFDKILGDLGKVIDVRNELYKSKEEVSLQNEWDNCCLLLKDSFDNRGSSIKSNFVAAPTIYTVKAFVHSIFYNLLSNSIKYRSPDRDLHISATSKFDDGYLVIEVTDNGLGFNSKKYHDSVFKLFKRFHMHVEGRGLGLYLVKSQVDALNGSITADSTEMVGTTFRILLPVVHPEVEGTASKVSSHMF